MHFVLTDIAHPNLTEIVNCCPKTNDFNDRWSTSLKLGGEFRASKTVESDIADHVATAQKWWHGV